MGGDGVSDVSYRGIRHRIESHGRCVVEPSSPISFFSFLPHASPPQLPCQLNDRGLRTSFHPGDGTLPPTLASEHHLSIMNIMSIVRSMTYRIITGTVCRDSAFMSSKVHSGTRGRSALHGDGRDLKCRDLPRGSSRCPRPAAVPPTP